MTTSIRWGLILTVALILAAWALSITSNATSSTTDCPGTSGHEFVLPDGSCR